MVFFIFGVPGQPDDFHAVLQRQRNVRQGVGGRNKQNVGQVVVQIQVMVVEGKVLLGIENLQQRRRRIAPEIHAHFIDFIQAKYRIIDADFFQGLENLAGKRPDVGPAVSPNFSFIPHAAQ